MAIDPFTSVLLFLRWNVLVNFSASLLPLLLRTLFFFFFHVKFGFVDLENKALKLHPTIYPVSSLELFVSRIDLLSLSVQIPLL